MPTTPVSVSTGVQSQINTTVYTVPVGKTAIVKAVTGQNSTTASVNLTISKYSGGQNFPVVYNQSSTQVQPTGGNDRNNQNALNAPLTMVAGEELRVFAGSDNRYSLPSVSTASNIAADGSVYTIYANAYANSIYMAVGSCSSGAYVATSPDAITWTQRTASLPLSTRFDILSSNGSIWVSGYTSNSDGTIYYSSDNGVTWTPAAVTGGTATAIRSVVSNGTIFVAFTANNRVYYSSDGSSWTQSTSYYTAVGTTSSQIYNVGWSGTHLSFKKFQQ